MVLLGVLGGFYRRAKLPCEVGAAYVFVFNEDEKMGRDWPAPARQRKIGGRQPGRKGGLLKVLRC